MIWSQVFRALSWITELCCNKMCEQHTGFCKQGIEGKINLLNSAPNNNFPQYTNDLDPSRYFVLYSHKMLFLQKFEFLEDGMEISAAWLLNYYISAAMNSHYHYINVKNVTLQNQIFCFFFKHHQVFQEKKKRKLTEIIGQKGKRRAITDSCQRKQAQLCTSALKKKSFCRTPETHFACAGGDVCSLFRVFSGKLKISQGRKWKGCWGH